MISLKLPAPYAGYLFHCQRVGMGMVFVYSGCTKLLRPADFLQNVYDYQILSPRMAFVMGGVLPPFEVFLGAVLVYGILVRVTAIVAIGLLAVFAAAQISVLARHLDVTCGCFGTDSDTVGLSTLVRVIALLAVGCWLAAMDAQTTFEPGAGAGPLAGQSVRNA